MTPEKLQRIASAQARLDIVEARSRFVDETLSAMTREEIWARRAGNKDEIEAAVLNLALAQALHAAYGQVLMDADAEHRQAVDEAYSMSENCA